MRVIIEGEDHVNVVWSLDRVKRLIDLMVDHGLTGAGDEIIFDPNKPELRCPIYCKDNGDEFVVTVGDTFKKEVKA